MNIISIITHDLRPHRELVESMPHASNFNSLKLLLPPILAGVILVITAWFLPGQPAPAWAQGSDLVQTDKGPVRGFQAGQTYAFLGIPFAAPPTGPLRWRPPADPQPWSGELAATAFGPPCPQWDDDAGAVIGNENCLTLNVWTPITATPGADLPVMLFMHGGGNVQGSASKVTGGIHLYDGQFLSERGGVVVVTLQYRLGALGFLVHSGLDGESEYGSSGNYGLLDQIKALTWVQDNIRNFGGDPSRVLLFGESGGGQDTCMLLTSPLAAGLFSRALIQSGGCVAKMAVERATEGVAFAEAAGCGSAPDPTLCLRDQTTTTLVTAIDTTPISNGLVAQAFGAAVDGHVLPRPPLQTLALGEQNPVPVVIGSNADEMLPMSPPMSTTLYNLLVHAMLNPLQPGAGTEALALYPVGDQPGQYPTAREAYAALVSDGQFTCPARRMARLTAQASDDPLYRYFFSQVLSSPLYAPLGSFHGLELWFVFQRVEAIQGYLARPEDVALQEAILGYWTRFAATGNPNGSGAVPWPAYTPDTDPYLELGTPVSAGAGLRPAKCDFWDSLSAPSLAVRLTSSAAAAVSPGETLTYTLTLANGGGHAEGVVISDTLDSNSSLVWASDGGLYESGVVTWSVDTLSATHLLTRSLVVTVGNVPDEAVLINTVWVTSTDGVSATATITTPVVASLSFSVYLPGVIK